jgi:hypothetical protein
VSFTPDALYTAILNDVKPYLEGLDPQFEVPPSVKPSQFQAHSLLRGLLKKLPPVDQDLADQASMDDFVAANNRCGAWGKDGWNDLDHLMFNELKLELDNFFHPRGQFLFSSYFDILKHAKMGPGSAIGTKQNSFYAKLFSSKMATTSTSLYTLYRSYIQWFSDFSDAEAIRYEKFGFPRVTNCSRSSFVPKTSSKSRMICVEPSLNVFYQLGLGALIADRLGSAFKVGLEFQPPINRTLAKVGSIDGSFATIDLSSASDSVSVELCRNLLPKYLFDTLMDLRCSFTDFGSGPLRLNMISTMGNGFTFPLQTVLFSCMIRATYRTLDIEVRDGVDPNWGCFGDDLICLTQASNRLLRLLTICGFTVNVTKSFFEGPFRESCGADWFSGQYCRPVYIRKHKTVQDTLVAVNLLNEWSARTGIMLRSSISYLLSTIGKKHLLLVPFSETNDSGLRVPFSVLNRGRIRYDRNLTILYRKFLSVPKRITFGDGVIRYPKGVRRTLIYNPPGLYLSFLLGELVSCSITVRHDDVRYRSKLGRIPHWDYVDSSKPFDGIGLDWLRWETAAKINIPY